MHPWRMREGLLPKENRASARQRGYTHRWEKARAIYLKAHPLCVMCQAEKPPRYTPACVVDHIQPHKGDTLLFWAQSNWQALCAPHHSATKQQIERRGYSSEIDESGWPTDESHPANKRRK